MLNYVGKVSGGRDVNIGKGSANEHMIITGISGAGKSVRITDIEHHIIESGGTVIAFDINGTHSDIADSYSHYISAQEDGLDVRFLDTELIEMGKETMTNLIQYVVETLCPVQMRGACQLASVRNAVKFALQNREHFSCDIEAIAAGLEIQNESAAVGAYNHLCPILEGDIFRHSTKRIQQGKVNVISLKGINPKTQKRVVEIMLNVLWRQMRIAGYSQTKFTLVLDEFQNFDFRQGTVLFQMLTEIRKYGINLILATQTLTIFSKKELAVINQAAVKLFFQQSVTDIKSAASLIDIGNKEKWILELSRLHVGQAITVGALEIGGRPIQQPIVTYSEYQPKENVLPHAKV